MRKLIVYFTYTGHTKLIVDEILKKHNCDVLELKPKTPYSTNMEEVVKEYRSNEYEHFTPEIEYDRSININDYDEIIIGIPIWWYRVAPVIRTFLKENNLKNKHVYPFVSYCGFNGGAFDEIKDLLRESDMEPLMVFTFDGDKLKTFKTSMKEWIQKL